MLALAKLNGGVTDYRHTSFILIFIIMIFIHKNIRQNFL